MRSLISVRGAAELAGVGEPAIRRAIREDRLAVPLIYFVGERHTSWISLDSLAERYGLTAADIERYQQWIRSNEVEPSVVMAGGHKWTLLDRGPVFHISALWDGTS